MTSGRPRQFDIEEVLRKAMEVFWRKGYEGTTLPDLTAAMGINRPSLYAAFGNKQSLFEKVVELYLQGPAQRMEQALRQPTSRQVVEHIFQRASEEVCRANQPAGCLIVQGALVSGDSARAVRELLASHRKAFLCQLEQRFTRARDEGDLPPNVDPADLARFICVLNNGIAVQAADGATAEELAAVIQPILDNWPPVCRLQIPQSGANSCNVVEEAENPGQADA